MIACVNLDYYEQLPRNQSSRIVNRSKYVSLVKKMIVWKFPRQKFRRRKLVAIN